MKRSTFIKTTGLGALSWMMHPACKNKKLTSATVSKRDRMLQWLEGKSLPGYIPAAFFIHFDAQHKLGTAAAEQHINFFRAKSLGWPNKVPN